MRFFVHYTPFDETFDPHALAAAYGTGLLDRDGAPIATAPQVPGYGLDACVARYTTNPLNVATIGVQTLMPPEQRGDVVLQATYRTALLRWLLAQMNEEFQRFLPAGRRDADLELKLEYMTVFLTREATDDTRTAFPAAAFLRMRVVNRWTGAEMANSYGANASYIFRDTAFYLVDNCLYVQDAGNWRCYEDARSAISGITHHSCETSGVIWPASTRQETPQASFSTLRCRSKCSGRQSSVCCGCRKAESPLTG
jgi:hypothetical protein